MLEKLTSENLVAEINHLMVDGKRVELTTPILIPITEENAHQFHEMLGSIIGGGIKFSNFAVADGHITGDVYAYIEVFGHKHGVNVHLNIPIPGWDNWVTVESLDFGPCSANLDIMVESDGTVHLRFHACVSYLFGHVCVGPQVHFHLPFTEK